MSTGLALNHQIVEKDNQAGGQGGRADFQRKLTASGVQILLQASQSFFFFYNCIYLIDTSISFVNKV